MGLASTAQSALESSLNRLIKSDPDTCSRMRKLAGKKIGVESWLVDEFGWSITITQEGLRLSSGIEPGCDAVIHGGPASLLRSGLNPGDRGVFLDTDIRISGDAGLVQAFTGLVHQFQPDWVERVAAATSDDFATWLESLVAQLSATHRRARHKLTEDTGEYLREESRILAGDVALKRYSDEVDELRADVDRIDLRIRRLERRLEQQPVQGNSGQ